MVLFEWPKYRNPVSHTHTLSNRLHDSRIRVRSYNGDLGRKSPFNCEIILSLSLVVTSIGGVRCVIFKCVLIRMVKWSSCFLTTLHTNISS